MRVRSSILLSSFLSSFCLILTVMPALAHHAFSAEYDAEKPVKLSGTVTKVEWENPHAWFYIDVKDNAGKLENWGFEMGSPNLLTRAGWGRNTLKIGDVVSVEASRAKSGANIANAKVVTLASTGQKLFTGSSQGQTTR
jgi:hypothetical protein